MQFSITETRLKYLFIFQSGRASWSDGRPTAFLLWNTKYSRGHGPDSIRYYSQTHGLQDAGFEQLLKRAKNIFQPQYTNETLCTVLIGLPGPTDMEFVTIPCDMELAVSGILCIKGGNKLGQNGPLYRLTHVKLKAKDSQLVYNATSHSFTIDTLYEALFQGRKPPVTQGISEIPIYYETLDQDAQTGVYDYIMEYKKVKNTWREDVDSCSNSRQGVDLCDILWPYNESNTNNLQKMTTDMYITKPYQDTQNTSLSIGMSRNRMFASDYCLEGTVFDGKQCIRLFQKPSDADNITLDNLCHKLSGKSHVYVYEVDGSLDTLTFILQRLDIVRGEASCHDELGNIVVLFLDAGNLSARVYNEVDLATKYVVCSLEPVQPTCPPAYVICNNGCVSEQFLCDGQVDCGNGEDEQNCSHLCDVSNATPHYCLARCHPENCTCHELYFQCSSGGCIYSSKVCDGYADCMNSEDESFCFSPTSTQRHISARTMFIPDKFGLSDQEIYIDLSKSVSKEIDDTCGSLHQVPCMEGYPACYPLDKACLYDHTEDGRLKYCMHGLHLLECEHFRCSGSFKCQYSYCVSTYKVCNDVQDCPYGDDEVMCPVSACINMLRCGQTCVHPSEICDGTMHCQFGEDELACGAPNCPPTCQCSGYAMKCHTMILLDTSFKSLTMFSLRQSKLKLVKQMFKYVASLLILDIAHCSITSISSEGPFLELSALAKLDLSHNGISSLVFGSLDGLISLTELDISWNPLNSLEPGVFVHMSRLRVLSMHHCQLRVVLDIALPNTQPLDIIDVSSGGMIDLGCFSVRVALLNLTDTIIQFRKGYSKKCWKDVTNVVSDQTGLCCLGFLKERCDGGWAGERKKCQSLFQGQVILIYCCILIMEITICNCCVFIYKVITKARDALFICNLALGNISIVVPLCNFVSWHVSHDTEFAFFETLLSESMRCRISGDILVISTQLSTLFQMLISLQKYCGIVRRCDTLSENKVLSYLVISATWITFILASALLRFQDMQDTQMTGMLDGLFYLYLHRTSILIAFLLLNLFFVLATTFFYGLILKNIYETRITDVGRKHGRDETLSSMIRVNFIMIFSNFSVWATVFATVWLSQLPTQSPLTVSLVVLTFPLQSVFNPFLYTLSTRKFVQDCGSVYHLL